LLFAAPLFELAWLGGVSEHHYRKARPELDLDWDTLDPRRYRPEAVQAARTMWTELVLSEYAAVAAFSDVVRTLAEAQAPLDLIGMTSDFLADEVRHVELTARVVMRLGGAVPRQLTPARLGAPPPAQLTAFQRANQLAITVGCIAEGFANGTAAPIMKGTRHPLLRAVYTAILRDEARHTRFGTLYCEWASARWTDEERVRLAGVAERALSHYAALGERACATTPTLADAETEELGWFQAERYGALVRGVIVHQLVPTLQRFELPVRVERVAPWLAG
jgi:hypothetical protein